MDSAAVNDKRLRIDARKWIASKFRPSHYGDRISVEPVISGADMRPADIMQRIVALLGEHGLTIGQVDQAITLADDRA